MRPLLQLAHDRAQDLVDGDSLAAGHGMRPRISMSLGISSVVMRWRSQEHSGSTLLTWAGRTLSALLSFVNSPQELALAARGRPTCRRYVCRI